MTRLRLLSTMAVQGLVEALAAEIASATGVALDAEFLPTVRLLERIRAGERGDVAILTAAGIDELIGEGVLEPPRLDVARSFIGVAVRSGAAQPAIGTRDEFVAALRAARSVAMSQAGASGLYMAGLLERLGIAAEVGAKATILPSGYTAALAASGKIELAIQQVSELKMVEGVDIVGRIPAELGGDSVFAAAPFRGADETARQALDYLADPARAPLYQRCGLELARTA